MSFKAFAKIAVFSTFFTVSVVLVFGDFDFPTYPAAMLLGACIFVLVFPFLYAPFYGREKDKKSFIKLWFKILLSDER